MTPYTSTLERAFELVRAGTCGSLDHLKRRLRDEGYQPEQITGFALRRQLYEIIRKRH
jgi:hypothetical protein